MYVVFSFVLVAAVVLTLVDIIRRDDGQIKNLPKVVWVLLVVFIPLIGVILWFAIGREYDRSPREAVSFGDPRRWDRSGSGSTARPGEASTGSRVAGDSRSTEEQLADLEREIEYYESRRAEKRADGTGE